jgi:pyridinium-3,5-bisthiocarboxylic acid mononucleotide nickel chelatase
MAGYHEGLATVIEANIDDMNPQFFEYLLERLLEAGALDVSFIPVQMKKNRPGTILHVLAQPTSVNDLLAIIFTESTTIGARTYEVTKRMLQRETHTVETSVGPIRVKVARLGNQVVNVAPEYEDCHELARRRGLPLKEVYALARAGFSRLNTP